MMTKLRDQIAAIVGEALDATDGDEREYADRILNLPQMSGWQPIETAPNRVSVILFDPNHKWVTVGYQEGGCWSDERDEDGPIFPSHWMHLPAPAASVDTHAERGDAKQAPSARMGSAVAKPDAHNE